MSKKNHPVCPHCKAEIDKLTCYGWDEMEGELRAGSDQWPEWMDTIERTWDEFTCPECRKVITTSEDEARAFLGNGSRAGRR